jgi:release factor glutamine methyltransferase
LKLREWLQHAESVLADGQHADRARLDAERLLLHHIGKNKAWIMAHGEEEFAGCSSIGYAALLERRRKGEPMQYITGGCEFYGLPFQVSPEVLIPRPETEHLVEQVLKLTRNGGAPLEPPAARPEPETTNPDRPLRILDVGTGSGAIIIALATQLPGANLTAVDISEPALDIARQNATRNNVGDRIRFLQSDLLAAVAGERFEIVASNPPYVPDSDRALIAVEVREHEPHIALFGGQDGLEVYRRLIPAAQAALLSGGYLVFEFGFSQQQDIEGLLAGAGFENIEFVSDLQGIPRVASARRP